MKVLQIISSGYRCTIEEQDDPVVWITHAMKGAGGDFDVLLKGNAVNYAAIGQDASGLSFGDCIQTQPPKLDQEVANLIAKDIGVYVVAEDLSDRGIDPDNCIDGINVIKRGDLAACLANYDQVWKAKISGSNFQRTGETKTCHSMSTGKLRFAGVPGIQDVQYLNQQ